VVLCGLGGDFTKVEVKDMKTGKQEIVQTYNDLRNIVNKLQQ
jgi:hypothetical protein